MAEGELADEDRVRLVQELCGAGLFGQAEAMLDDDWVRRSGSRGYLLRAYVNALKGEPQRSREAVDWALLSMQDDVPGRLDLLCLAGHVLLALGDEHRALAVARRAAADDPHDWRPPVLLADAYVELGRVPQGIAAARRAVALAPHEGEAQLALARSLERYPQGLGRFGEGARRARAERDEARQRASVLGAEGETTRRGRLRAEAVLRVVLVVGPLAVMTVHLWWGLALVVLVHAAFAAVVLLAHRRRGGRPFDRLQAARAIAREEWQTDPVRRRTAGLGAVALVPLAAFATTGIAAAYGAEGRLWPWAGVLAAALASLALLALGAALLRWWYGAGFLRTAVAPLRPVGWQPAVNAAFAVVTLAAASWPGAVGTGWWLALTGLHALWAVGGMLGNAVRQFRVARLAAG
ncbi:hypothetical protein QNO07_10395 [Streptomyces sp. 549]|uniref:tetratricopeptide repeat protein n=1 Tax=Streptomyces sp. 549 TaxID=3049076 RepID=UPI0024C4149D|nr:hypothetical protein [Streptomyces sp. 549]MDK1473825.1 hypothetical protein [Streptomyces sp. 549]